MSKAFSISVAELVDKDPSSWPKELSSKSHLITSSPAALAFNSPGAEGFGVKRAALTLPGSVMLLFSPVCCGRNTSAVGGPESALGKRMFYLLLNETDIVTGRYMGRIVEACQEIVQSTSPKPTVLLLCSTCVDALLATDMVRLTRKVTEQTGIPALAATMYALTREGHTPPMVAIRQTLYSLLKKAPKHADTINLVGYFTALAHDCELPKLLRSVGVNHIYELATLKDMDEYQEMAHANCNLVLDFEARHAAQWMAKTLEIPFIELTRTYQRPKIRTQYELLGQILGVTFPLTAYEDKAKSAEELLGTKAKGARIAIGETCNANPFDLAISLVDLGLSVPLLFAEPSAQALPSLKRLAAISPQTRILSNLSPSMLFYDPKETPIDATIGSDARFYHPEACHLDFLESEEPFGYAGLANLCSALAKML